MATATFAAGCFWGVEASFRRLPGVLDTQVGYTGGHTSDPTYREVCSGRTGHAEAVRVTYDPAVIGYLHLLDAFFGMHDPTTRNRQVPDVGPQYRSAIYFHDAEQETLARSRTHALDTYGRFERPIVTEIAPAGPFWPAEEYHQRYLQKREGAACAVRQPGG